MNLQEQRAQLDEIDSQLAALFQKRMDLVADVAACKEAYGVPRLVKSREEAILSRVASQVAPSLAPYAQKLFQRLMELSRDYQDQLCREAPAYGLLGEHLGHSFSPRIHWELGGYRYGLFPMAPEAVENFLRQRPFRGINVTIPYKQKVMALCDEIDPAAQSIGAVNTIVNRDGRLIGSNTDLAGLLYLARRTGVELRGKNVVILGSGGTSHTAQAAARGQGAREITVISRTGPDNYQNLERHRDAQVLIQTTPVGMWPQCGEAPVSLDCFPHLEGVLDVVYNPLKTALVLEAEARGIPCSGGLPMLCAQARDASEAFQGAKIPDEVLEEVLRKLERQVQNVVLIGMPGCGKSSLGRALAQKMERDFLDLDEMVEEKIGMSIPAFFAAKGEEAFRELEAQAVREAGGRTGCVISTGGGVILRRENWAPLQQNGLIFHIVRPLDQLSRRDRPLSQCSDLSAMWEKRRPLYRALAHRTILNTGTPEETLACICKELEAS